METIWFVGWMAISALLVLRASTPATPSLHLHLTILSVWGSFILICMVLWSKPLNWVLFVDDSSHFSKVFCLHSKSEVFDAFKLFHVWAETQTGCKIKALQDDKGGEYMSSDFENYLQSHGIKRRHSTQATPQQNGVAELMN